MKNSRILVVDDNESVLSALELLLQPLCKEMLPQLPPIGFPPC